MDVEASVVGHATGARAYVASAPVHYLDRLIRWPEHVATVICPA